MSAVTGQDQTDFPEAMLQVYEDFKDVRYEGCRYRAFAQWWRHKVSAGETWGEYLFAEPVIKAAAREVIEESDIKGIVSNKDELVISINLNHQRQHIDAAIDRILKRSLTTIKGRKARDPKISQARYHLSKIINISSLKKTFLVYDLRNNRAKEREMMHNYDIADMIGLSNKNDTAEINDNGAERRKKTVKVSRYHKAANDIIKSVGFGKFVF